MLNQTSRYTLSLLCYLVRHSHERVPARQIAVDTGTPANYVAKILSTLRKGGVVEAEKGWGGGYALRPRAGDISVGEVMALFEDRVGIAPCPFVQPVCGCCYLDRHGEERVPVRRSGGETDAPARFAPGLDGDEAPANAGATSVTCLFGAAECVVSDPCPLHGHWARLRTGFWGMAETRIGELVDSGDAGESVLPGQAPIH